MIGPKFILQQDNNPKYTATVIKNYPQCSEEQEVLELMISELQEVFVGIK